MVLRYPTIYLKQEIQLGYNFLFQTEKKNQDLQGSVILIDINL